MLPIYRFERMLNAQGCFVYALEVSFNFIYASGEEPQESPYVTVATFDKVTLNSFKKMKPGSTVLDEVNVDEFLVMALMGSLNVNNEFAIGLPGASTSKLSSDDIYPLDADFPGLYKIFEQHPDHAFHYHHKMSTSEINAKLLEMNPTSEEGKKFFSDFIVTIVNQDEYELAQAKLFVKAREYFIGEGKRCFDQTRNQLFSTYETMIGIIRLIAPHDVGSLTTLLFENFGIYHPSDIEESLETDLAEALRRLHIASLDDGKLGLRVSEFSAKYLMMKSKLMLEAEFHLTALSEWIADHLMQPTFQLSACAGLASSRHLA